jgi:hypothetical protein
VQHSDDDLWSFPMLPDTSQVSTVFFAFCFFARVFILIVVAWRKMVSVNAPTSDPLTPRSQAANRAAQQQEHDRAAQAKERKIRRQERLDQHNEDYQLREQ